MGACVFVIVCVCVCVHVCVCDCDCVCIYSANAPKYHINGEWPYTVERAALEYIG